MNSANIFSERLRKLRQHQKLTQKALAQHLETTQQQVALYESGKSLPAIDTLIAVADTFNTTTDYLLGLTHTPEKNILPISSLDQFEMEAVTILRTQSSNDEKARLVEILRLAAR